MGSLLYFIQITTLVHHTWDDDPGIPAQARHSPGRLQCRGGHQAAAAAPFFGHVKSWKWGFKIT